MLGKILGAQIEPNMVIAILEFTLACYDVALIFNTRNKMIKIIHIVLGILWVLLGVLNLLGV